MGLGAWDTQFTNTKQASKLIEMILGNDKYSPFLLFGVIMFHKVATNIMELKLNYCS